MFRSTLVLSCLLVACAPVEDPVGSDRSTMSDGAGASEASSGLGGTWSLVVDPSEDEPDLLPTEATLYVPPGLTDIRGVLAISAHAIGPRMFASDPWREFAREQSLALVLMDLAGVEDGIAHSVLEVPDQGGRQVERVLAQLASASGVDAVDEAPLFLWGHSAGGFMVTALSSTLHHRLAGYVPWHGPVHSSFLDPSSEIHEALLAPEARGVPALFMIGDADLSALLRLTPRWMWMAEQEPGPTPWTLFVQHDCDHWGLEGSDDATFLWIAAVLDEQRTDDAASMGVQGLDLVEEGETAWLETRYAHLGEPESDDDPLTAWSWLPDAAFADHWLEHAAAGVVEP